MVVAEKSRTKDDDEDENEKGGPKGRLFCNGTDTSPYPARRVNAS